ncbi:MAG: hypothetical protein PWP23_2038 [Candidatus Sumerlaeota bacterium]|nr:hypothetical protein [Candidatus Sumerlaeota bacterium]
MTVEEREAGLPDLTFTGLTRLVIEHWRNNPLCRRVWRRIRPWALVFMLIQTIMVGLSLWSVLLQNGTGSPVLSPLSMVAIYGGICFFLVIGIAIWILAPILYSKWAYRRYYTDDPMLRTTTLSRTDRLLGFMVPALVAITFYSIPTAVGGTVSELLSTYFSTDTEFPLSGGPVSLALAGLSAFSSAVFGCIFYFLQFPTCGLRTLLLDSQTGQLNRRRWGSVAVVYLLSIGISIGWGTVRSLPIIAISSFGAATFALKSAGSGTPPGAFSLSHPEWVWILAYLFMIAADYLGLWMAYLAMRYFWKRDIPLARRTLFDAPPPQTGTNPA